MKKEIAFALKTVVVCLLFALLLLILGGFFSREGRFVFAHNPVIVLDAGHGGPDGGASSASGVQEKDVALAIALQLRNMLETAGIQAIMTRSTDQALCKENFNKAEDIKNRFSYMENYPNAVFVSIHLNSFTQSQYKGAQVFYGQGNEKSCQIAESITRAIVSRLQPDNKRAVQAAGSNIYLLHYAKSPAVLIECGFLSNPDEARLLATQEYQKKMALAIFEGLMNYYSTEQ